MNDDIKKINEGLATRAKSLIQRAFKSYDTRYGLSTASCQAYDTAWVAMVTKMVDGEKQWLFPKCFHYLLETQSDDGGWGTPASSQTAGILDTAAALLAIIRHSLEPLQITFVSPYELQRRIACASESLRIQLDAWDDLKSSNHVGVEVVLPSLLEYLEQEDSALKFEFKEHELLKEMRVAKLSRFNTDSLYGETPSSIIYSLEAFIGKIEFDRVKHHLFQGSMLASPSSTAAYLMNVSQWDEEAEAYLQHVVEAGTGFGNGGIPGTFPITYFEYSWILATLLGAGFSTADLECLELHGIKKILIEEFDRGNGIIGYAPHIADVDDTAKGLLALNMLGELQHVSPDAIINVFETDDHFWTCGAERDPSFSSHCHVLLTLLHQTHTSHYLPQIQKTINFILRYSWDHDGRIKDKWHLSYLYPAMLTTEAFSQLLQLLDNGQLLCLLKDGFQPKVGILLIQTCLRTLLDQREDGSWNGMPEETSYGVLLLAKARHLSLFSELRVQLQTAIDRGVVFLRSYGFRSAERNWTSKTAYGIIFVTEAYILAALRIAHPLDTMKNLGRSFCLDISTGKVEGYISLVRKTPQFSSLPDWHIRASLLESALFVPLLQTQRLAVYARDEMNIDKDEFLDIISFSWICCNNRAGTFVSNKFLFDSMMLSMLSFQTNEFFKAIAGPRFAGKTIELHELVEKVVAEILHVGPQPSTKGNLGAVGDTFERIEVGIYMSGFVSYVLNHHVVATTSSWDCNTLGRYLLTYLHAQVAQVEDNALLEGQSYTIDNSYEMSDHSAFQWVTAIAADHVAVPLNVAFGFCLISSTLGAKGDLFPTVKEKYFSAAVLRHMSTMVRVYNDFGTVARENAEHNVHFVPFSALSEGSSEREPTTKKREILGELGEYERSCMAYTLECLEKESLKGAQGKTTRKFVKRKMELLKFECEVAVFSHLYAQHFEDSHAKIPPGP